MKQAIAPNRNFGMDWLRIGAFALLILYHGGMAFVPWDWHVKASDPLPELVYPMLAMNAWRLSLLFMVSGFATGALLAKGGGGAGGFAASRSKRLLVPLIAAIILVVPPQPWVELMFKHGYPFGYGDFWSHDYFRFGELDGLVLPTWQHLWFVVYLWVYSMLLAAAIRLGRTRGMAARAERLLGGWKLLLLPLAMLALRALLLRTSETHDLFTDIAAHTEYPLFFLFGIALQRSAAIQRDVVRLLPLAWPLALAATLAVLAVEHRWPGTMVPPDWAITFFRLARAVQCWASVLALTGIALKFGNRDHRWRPVLNEAVFPFYIVHQTIIVLAIWWLRPLGLDGWVAFPLVCAVTAWGCLAFYLMVRSVPALRLAGGLKPLAKRRRAATSPDHELDTDDPRRLRRDAAGYHRNGG